MRTENNEPAVLASVRAHGGYNYRSLLAAFVDGSKSSKERKFQGAKVPYLELSLLGANVLGSEKSIIPAVYTGHANITRLCNVKLIS